MKFVKSKKGVGFSTFKEIAIEHREPKNLWLKKEDILNIIKSIGNKITYTNIGKTYFSASQIFSLLSWSLKYYIKNKTFPVDVPVNKTIGPVEEIVGLKKLSVSVSTKSFFDLVVKVENEIESFGYLPSKIKIGNNTIGTGEFFNAMKNIFIILVKQKVLPNQITIKKSSNYPDTIEKDLEIFTDESCFNEDWFRKGWGIHPEGFVERIL